jgi:hypothetical protein
VEELDVGQPEADMTIIFRGQDGYSIPRPRWLEYTEAGKIIVS